MIGSNAMGNHPIQREVSNTANRFMQYRNQSQAQATAFKQLPDIEAMFFLQEKYQFVSSYDTPAGCILLILLIVLGSARCSFFRYF